MFMVEIFKNLELHQQRSCEACVIDILHSHLTTLVMNRFYEHLFSKFISKSKAVKGQMATIGNTMYTSKPK